LENNPADRLDITLTDPKDDEENRFSSLSLMKNEFNSLFAEVIGL
jgi:hypothetical protein